MPDIETSIIIEKPVEVVSKVFYDFDRYNDWSEFIKVISPLQKDTELTEGTNIEVHLQLPGKSSVTVMKPQVLKKSDSEFLWRGTLGVAVLFSGAHKFEFTGLENNTKTKFTQSETFGGVLKAPLLYFIKEDTQAGFKKFNEALKKAAEDSDR